MKLRYLISACVLLGIYGCDNGGGSKSKNAGNTSSIATSSSSQGSAEEETVSPLELELNTLVYKSEYGGAISEPLTLPYIAEVTRSVTLVDGAPQVDVEGISASNQEAVTQYTAALIAGVLASPERLMDWVFASSSPIAPQNIESLPVSDIALSVLPFMVSLTLNVDGQELSYWRPCVSIESMSGAMLRNCSGVEVDLENNTVTLDNVELSPVGSLPDLSFDNIIVTARTEWQNEAAVALEGVHDEAIEVLQSLVQLDQLQGLWKITEDDVEAYLEISGSTYRRYEYAGQDLQGGNCYYIERGVLADLSEGHFQFMSNQLVSFGEFFQLDQNLLTGQNFSAMKSEEQASDFVPEC